jgi:hypothetical protein
MKKCFLDGYGECDGKLTGEHYISRTVLESISKGKMKIPIGGLSWQPESTLQEIGIGSLESNILCYKHNSGLSPLDALAGQFYRYLDGVDKNPADVEDHFQVDGESIERWFLKVLCGLVKSSSIRGCSFKDEWLQILTGKDWPELWGLYVPAPTDSQILNNEFYVELKVNPETNEILAADFRVAGVPFVMVFGTPGSPNSFGEYRPRGLIFELPLGEKRLEFIWKQESERAIIYKKVGTTKESHPQHRGWK